MQFKIPQFIEMDDRIFGPFTFKQFIYIVGGLGLAFSITRVVPAPLSYLLALGAGAMGFAFALVEIHGKPLIFFVGAVFWYLTHTKLYIWKKEKKTTSSNMKTAKAPSETPLDLPAVSANKLRDLAWGLDINEHIAQARMKEEMKKHEANTSELHLQV